MAIIRRRIASCDLGGRSVVTIAYDDQTLEFKGLRLRGLSTRRVTIRIHRRGRSDLVQVRGRNIGIDKTLTANFKMVRKTIKAGTPKEREVVVFPPRIGVSCEWVP